MDADSFFDDSTRERLESEYEEFGIEYCLNPSRFEWTEIEKVKDENVLDLGCGFGGASVLSAQRGANEVFAVDGNLGRLRFLASWAEKEEIDTITPVHADALELSYQSGSFDCCIMTGSLEWMGAMSNTEDSPREAQQTVLKAVRNGLAENATTLIAIENRFALQNFVGYTPHLVEPPFTTIMPRGIANIISKVAVGRPYNVYTYSYYGYKKMLRESGFENLEFYYPVPNYHNTIAITSTTNHRVISDILSRIDISLPKSVAKKALVFLAFFGLAHLFMPSYIIEANV